jgi:50S ribosomal protein L16 3-hydroxylase
MPNLSEMTDQVSDKFAENALLKNPLVDIARQQTANIGEINSTEFAYLKAELLNYLSQAPEFDSAIMSYMSQSNYPNSIPEPDEIAAEDLIEIIGTGYQLMLEPASKLLYRTQADGLDFWANGENVCISKSFENQLKQIADGQSIAFDENLNQPEYLEDIAELLNNAVVMLLPPN